MYFMSRKYTTPHFSDCVNVINMKSHPVVALYQLNTKLQRHFQNFLDSVYIYLQIVRKALLIYITKSQDMVVQSLEPLANLEKSGKFAEKT